MEGLSAKSVVVSFLCQFIVFLYLLDNETSWMILASSGVGCCIEFWKIGKAMHIEVWVHTCTSFAGCQLNFGHPSKKEKKKRPAFRCTYTESLRLTISILIKCLMFKTIIMIFASISSIHSYSTCNWVQQIIVFQSAVKCWGGILSHKCLFYACLFFTALILLFFFHFCCLKDINRAFILIYLSSWHTILIISLKLHLKVCILVMFW